MMIMVDKFFISELQEKGFDLDYNKVVEIYRSSRNKPACLARKEKNKKEKIMIEKIEKIFSKRG